MVWESERLLYRFTLREDLDDLFRIYGDPETHKFNPRGPWPDREYAVQAMERIQESYRDQSFGDWTIFEKAHPEKCHRAFPQSYSLWLRGSRTQHYHRCNARKPPGFTAGVGESGLNLFEKSRGCRGLACQPDVYPQPIQLDCGGQHCRQTCLILLYITGRGQICAIFSYLASLKHR